MSKLLSLCLIVKNEEAFLRNCLEPFQGLDCDIIITDTGSVDGTLAIAAEFTNKVFIFPFTNNFSEARNWTLDQVKTPWVVFLDADEVLCSNQIHQLTQSMARLDQQVDGALIWRYNFFANGGWYTSQELKIFRSDPEIRYEGSVGESVKGAIQKRGNQVAKLPIILNHFGHTRSAKIRDKKSYQYLQLMQQEVAKNPNHARLWGYQGLIYRTLGKFELAIECAKKALEIAPNSAHAHFCFAQVKRAIGENEAALHHYQLASQLSPEDPLLLNLLGVMYLTMEKLTEAELTLHQALQLAPFLTHIKVNLGLLSLFKQQFEQADDYFKEVKKENPYFFYLDMNSLKDWDPFRQFYFDTILNYSGLPFYDSFVKQQLKDMAGAC